MAVKATLITGRSVLLDDFVSTRDYVETLAEILAETGGEAFTRAGGRLFVESRGGGYVDVDAIVLVEPIASGVKL